jgi:hypothetical protein
MELNLIAGAVADLGMKQDQHHARMRAMIENFYQQQTEAIMLDLSAVMTLSGTGFGLADLGGPPASYYWVVRMVSVSDAALWATTMTGALTQFGKGNLPTAPAQQMQPVTVRWAFATGPAIENFGTNHFNLKHGDRLYCQVTAGNAAQNIQATAYVEQWSIFSRTDYGAGPESHS